MINYLIFIIIVIRFDENKATLCSVELERQSVDLVSLSLALVANNLGALRHRHHLAPGFREPEGVPRLLKHSLPRRIQEPQSLYFTILLVDPGLDARDDFGGVHIDRHQRATVRGLGSRALGGHGAIGKHKLYEAQTELVPISFIIDSSILD